jgi:gliding motility-associated protein GldM
MAGGKESPRQKMIGMMYLVLTALLALNVSKDILDAFVVINQGLLQTNLNIEQKNKLLYEEFDKAKGLDRLKTMPYWEKAQQVKVISAEMFDHIEGVKKKIIAYTEQLPDNVADTISLEYIGNKDNYDKPTFLFFGSSADGKDAMSGELKQKINQFRTDLYALLDKQEAANLKLGLETNDVVNANGKETWEVNNFYHTPLAASVTILSKLQADVRNAEYDVISNLLKYVNKKDFKFDTITAKVIPQSNYVLLGEEYKADVFLAAFSTTNNPEILAGKEITDENYSESIPVENGFGKYTGKADKEGVHEWGGVIRMKTADGEKNYPFKSEYIVARPSLVVSPLKMNVLYQGVDNPVAISVPGIPSENLSVSISGNNQIKKQSDGTYMVNISNLSSTQTEINVSAILNNGEKKAMGGMKFRVKQLPPPQARIANIVGSGKMSSAQLAAQIGIIAEYGPDVDFNLLWRVTTYKMFVFYRGNPIDLPGTGNKISDDMKKVIKQLSKGHKVYFEEIKATSSTGVEKSLPTISVEIM